MPAASPGFVAMNSPSSSSATSRRPINTSLRSGGWASGERGTRTLLHPPTPPSSLHSDQIVAVFPHFHRAPPHALPFLSFSFFFLSTFPPSLPLSVFPAQRPLPGYACSARFGCVFVTRFSQVPGLTLYVSLRSRSLLPLLSPSSTSPGRPALLQMHRCSSLQGPAKKNGLPAAAGS